MEMFSTANAAKNDIMARLAAEGKLSNTPIETPATAVITEEVLDNISDEIL
jgi:hypothetical protein